MKSEPEVSVAVRAKAGDHQAFSVLVGRYHAAIYGLAFRMLSRSDEAEGVTQTVFVKAYERISDFDPSRRFFSWIYRIAVNESIDRLERRKRHVSLDPGLVSRAPDPEEVRTRSESTERLERALEELTPELRVVIVMRHFEDLSYQEIGEILDIPAKTVKSRLYTARRRLAGALAERERDEAARP